MPVTPLNDVIHMSVCTLITNPGTSFNYKFYTVHCIKSHVDKESCYFQVNGTLVTHYNHIEVVNLIKCKCEVTHSFKVLETLTGFGPV